MQATTSDGKVPLTEREVMLVRFFTENDGRVLTRGELLERVWGYTFEVDGNVVDQFISYLRKKTEDGGEPRIIHTVRGVGFVLRP